jgi:hypothetical protein
MSETLGALFGLVILMIVYILVSALFIRWGWALFMTPVFGLRDLAWSEAIGFGFLAGALKPYNYGEKNK